MTNLQATPRAHEGPLLEVTDLRTHFRTERGVVRAVDGVSFSLQRGISLGVVGESGSGKTVLSRSIMGLISGRQTEMSGSVRFAGQEILNLPSKQMRHLWGQEMAMIFQDPMGSLNPLMKIGRQIAEPLQAHLGMSRDNVRATSVQLLRDVRIPEPDRRLKQYPHELSGGMRQRVMIAIALACGPTLLLADEPTTALDVTVQAQIVELLRDLQARHDLAYLFISHDLKVVRALAHDLIVMKDGKVVEQGPADAVFDNPRTPYTKALMAAAFELKADTSGVVAR